MFQIPVFVHKPGFPLFYGQVMALMPYVEKTTIGIQAIFNGDGFVCKIIRKLHGRQIFKKHISAGRQAFDLDVIIGLKHSEAGIAPDLQASFFITHAGPGHKRGLPLKKIADGAPDVTPQAARTIIDLQHRVPVSKRDFVKIVAVFQQ